MFGSWWILITSLAWRQGGQLAQYVADFFRHCLCCSLVNKLKGQFTPKSKIFIFPLNSGAVYPDRLFWVGVAELWGCWLDSPVSSIVDDWIMANKMELDITWLVVLKASI